MRKAIIVQFISRYSLVIIQFIVNFVISRIISPSDFGVVAIITVFSSFFLLLSDLGIGPAIVQYRDLRDEEINDIYSFSAYIAGGLFFAFILLGFFVSKFYTNPVYVPICCILSFSIFFSTLNIVPNAMLMREQLFIKVGYRNVITAVVCGSIEIILALLGFIYYALVAYNLLQAIIRFIWNRITCRLRFDFLFDSTPIKRIFRYSAFQAMFSIILYFCGNTDTILVGKKMGEELVGLYNKSFQLITYPTQMFSGVITPVLHPVLSNYQNDRATMFEYLCKLFLVLLYSSIWISSVIFFAPNEVVRILYGKGWELAVTSVQLLSLSIVTRMCNSITGSFYQALGRTDLLFKIGLYNACIIIGGTVVGVVLGEIETVAKGVSISYIIVLFPTYFYLIKKAFNRDFFKFIKLAVRPLIIYVLLLIMGWVIKLPSFNMVLSLIIKTLLISAAYFFLLCITGELKHFKKTFCMVFNRRSKIEAM